MLNFHSSHNITEKSHLCDTDKLDQVMSHLIGDNINTKKNINTNAPLNGGFNIKYPDIKYDKSTKKFTVLLSIAEKIEFNYKDLINSIMNINTGSPIDLFIKKNIGYIDKNKVVIINHRVSPIMGDIDMLVRLNNDLKWHESNELDKLDNNNYIVLLFIYELLNYTLEQLVIVSDMIKDKPDKQVLSKYILRYTVANTYRMYNFSTNMNQMLLDKINNLEEQKDKSGKIMNIIGGKTDDMLKHINHNNSCFQKIAANNKIYTLVGGDNSSDSDSDNDNDNNNSKLETDSEDEEYLNDDENISDETSTLEEKKKIEEDEEDENTKELEEEVEKESDSTTERDSDKDEQESE
jgi:hypothetical protein